MTVAVITGPPCGQAECKLLQILFLFSTTTLPFPLFYRRKQKNGIDNETTGPESLKLVGGHQPMAHLCLNPNPSSAKDSIPAVLLLGKNQHVNPHGTIHLLSQSRPFHCCTLDFHSNSPQTIMV
jgi:hypothetical protein